MADFRKPSLIAATLTETMKVRDRDARAIGTVHSLMIHKRSNRALYAVLGLGGFLGMGGAYYAVPMSLLTYGAADDLYVAAIDPKALQGGPSWTSRPPTFDQDYADRVSSYYGADKQSLELG